MHKRVVRRKSRNSIINNAADIRCKQVRRRARKGRERHAGARIFKIPAVDRHGLCPTDTEKQKEHRTHRVNACKRVQRQATLILCGRVTEFVRHPTVRKLVQRQRKENNDERG